MSVALRVALAGLLAASVTTPVVAEDFRNYRPWDFKVRRNPTAMARAATMWQVEQAGTAGSASSSSTAGAVSSTSSIGNMNVITVVVGSGGVADVAVETEQSNLGTVDGRSVTATGAVVGIGSIQ
jgi:hypothetical protein